MSMFKQSTSVQ